MPLWEPTHGKSAGAYMVAGPNQLYVKRKSEGWAWYVDGILMGVAGGEATAKAASEAAVRAMGGTHTGAMAAAAG